MTIEELIEELKLYNPKEEIYISMKNGDNDERLFYDIAEIYIDRSGSCPQICITSY